jgi:hypothetical protein
MTREEPGTLTQGALVLWCFVFVVTESSTGPIKRFKEMTVAHVGVHGSGFPGSPLSGTLLSYSASTVARTSDRGHVAEVSSADVAERGVTSIGVRSSGNLCVEYV